LAALPRFTATASGGGLPFEVELEVRLDGSARQYRVVEIRGDDLTAEVLRKIPIEAILRASAQSALLRFEEVDGTVRSEPLAFTPPPRLVGGPSDETLQVVALAYRSAVLFDDDPTETVAKRLDLPRSTAGRWVRLARDRGFLGEALPAKAGEVPKRTRGKGKKR
jgi:hypothetical protein